MRSSVRCVSSRWRRRPLPCTASSSRYLSAKRSSSPLRRNVLNGEYKKKLQPLAAAASSSTSTSSSLLLQQPAVSPSAQASDNSEQRSLPSAAASPHTTVRRHSPHLSITVQSFSSSNDNDGDSPPGSSSSAAEAAGKAEAPGASAAAPEAGEDPNSPAAPTNNGSSSSSSSTTTTASPDDQSSLHHPDYRKLMGESLQPPAGPLWGKTDVEQHATQASSSSSAGDLSALGEETASSTPSPHPSALSNDDNDHLYYPPHHEFDRQFIPQVSLHDEDGRYRKRVLMLCTGGTLTMAPSPQHGGALAPVQGALSRYLQDMGELNNDGMPEVVLHEYTPFRDSSDLGPADWARLAHDIRANYLHFDGFVVITGTDTMAYQATALSFMLENLGKPVVFTGSQIPLCEPYNDGRRNIIMALIFASRDNTINEVSIFFHDRLLRACRATKVNTHRLLAFDSPNQDPLATIGITIDENEHLLLPPAKGALRVHSRMDTRLLTLRLVPGFDDAMIREMIQRNHETNLLRCIVLQLYGTGNIPSIRESFIQLLADATAKDILVVASTQCFTGSVMMGHYAVGKALVEAGVVSASDMTLEAIACKVGYLYGRGDLTHEEVSKLMGVSLRGEITPPEALSPPPLSSAYQRASRKGKRYY